MKKLLIIEIIVAVLFLTFLVVSVGILSSSIRSMKTSKNGIETQRADRKQLQMQMGNLQEDFSPLQYQGVAQENLLSLCFDNLLSRDESGRVTSTEGKGWKKGELAFSHITSRKEQDGSTYLTISINPDKKAFHGSQMTARDVIFNYYLRLDASSGLSDCFAGTEIVGAREYTYGSNDIAGRQKEIDKLLLSPSQALKERIQNEIIRPELQREYLWVQGLYGDEKFQFITSKYTKPKDLFAYYYAYQTSYVSGNRTESQVMEDIVAQYGANYIALGKVTERDYSEQAKRMALGELLKQSGKDTVTSVSGIRLIDEQTVEIHVLAGENPIEKICDFWVLPLESYGEKSMYNGTTCFGFQKGQAKKIVSLTQEKFLGTGAFYMAQKNPDILTLTRNPFFQKKVGLEKLEIIRKEFEKPEEIIKEFLKGKLDMAVVKEEESLDKLLNNRGTGAAHRIKRIKMQSDNLEESILYRTDSVNATTLPRKKQTIRGIFQEFYRIKCISK
ncbi:MAG: hypothetical protein HFH62_12265 [Lachnospiraceae bacterium]|nr:hypothetical protein [Lachnospiraceae bacterium]